MPVYDQERLRAAGPDGRAVYSAEMQTKLKIAAVCSLAVLMMACDSSSDMHAEATAAMADRLESAMAAPGRPDEDNAKLHRIEVSDVERLLTAAGFVIEARSDLLANPEDNHMLNVFDPDIRRRTDRVVLRARRR